VLALGRHDFINSQIQELFLFPSPMVRAKPGKRSLPILCATAEGTPDNPHRLLCTASGRA
jgi:hypothetical protein